MGDALRPKNADGGDGAPTASTEKMSKAWSLGGIRVVIALAVVILGYHVWFYNARMLCGVSEPLSVEDRAVKILKENPLIDGHDDLMILIRVLYGNHIYSSNFRKKFEDGGMSGHVDLPRLRQGMSSGAFWSAFMPCPKNWTNFDNDNYAEVVRATYEQLDLFHRLAELYPKHFTPSHNSAAATAAFENGKLISPLAIEGLHQIGNSVANLRAYFQLGVRYATVTWNCHNIYADAALVTDNEGKIVASEPYWHGVSPAGRKLISEMNRLGMIVDLAHVSKDTMVDILGGSPDKGWNGSIAPPIFSHSSAYALCPHPRNVPDDVLELVRKRNALVMVNISPDFISCIASDSPSGLPDFYPANSTLEQVVRHIRYIGERIGYEHVGIGTDFDGIAHTPLGLEDVSKFPDLVAEMLRQGITDKDAARVTGRNLLRVWKDVDEVSKMLQEETHPLEDDITVAGEEFVRIDE